MLNTNYLQPRRNRYKFLYLLHVFFQLTYICVFTKLRGDTGLYKCCHVLIQKAVPIYSSNGIYEGDRIPAAPLSPEYYPSY